MRATRLLVVILILTIGITCQQQNSSGLGHDQMVYIDTTYNDTTPHIYTLLPASIKMLPYGGHKSVVFEDTAGKTLEFKIYELESLMDSLYRKSWDIEADNDLIIQHNLVYEFKQFLLVNDTFELDFTVELVTVINDTTLESSRLIRDQMKIFALMEKQYTDSINYDFYIWNTAFATILNNRNWPFNPKYDKNIIDTLDSWCFNDVEFHNVLSYSKKNSIDPYKLKFCYAYGIVGFEDWSGGVWGFKTFKD